MADDKGAAPAAIGKNLPLVEQVDKKSDAARGPGEDNVRVKALKFFPDRDADGNVEQKGPDSDPFEVSRHRAAELRANGLIEYADAADEEREIQEKTELAATSIREKYERDNRARNAQKAKPLVNPKINMADPKA